MTRKWEINYDPQEGDPVVYLGVHALRWPYHSGVEPTVAFCDAEDDSDEEIERLRADNAKLRAAYEALLAIKLFTKYKDDCSCAWCLAARALEETK